MSGNEIRVSASDKGSVEVWIDWVEWLAGNWVVEDGVKYEDRRRFLGLGSCGCRCLIIYRYDISQVKRR